MKIRVWKQDPKLTIMCRGGDYLEEACPMGEWDYDRDNSAKEYKSYRYGFRLVLVLR